MLTLDINGKQLTTDAADDTPLLWVLRDSLNLTGTKFGCGMAQCGACTVHVDGQPTRSCVLPVSALAGKYDMSFAAVQKHVAVLDRAGLLTKRRQGREQLASGDVAAVRSVATMLTELEHVWRGRIARIDQLLASDSNHQEDRPCP